MQIKTILYNTLSELFIRKRNTGLAIILLTICFILVQNSFASVYAYTYHLRMVDKSVSGDRNKICKIDYKGYSSTENNQVLRYLEFKENITSIEGVLEHGEYLWDYINIMSITEEQIPTKKSALGSASEMENMEAEEQRKCLIDIYEGSTEDEILYLDEKLIPICDIRDKNNQTIKLSQNAGRDVIYVGANLKDKYKVGELLFDNYTGRIFVIAGIIKKGQQFIPNSLYDGNQSLLDNVIVTSLNKDGLTDNYIAGNYMYMNNHYIIVDETFEKGDLIQYAKEYNVFISVNSLMELEQKYKAGELQYYWLYYMQIAFIMFLTLASVTLMNVENLYSKRREIGIL